MPLRYTDLLSSLLFLCDLLLLNLALLLFNVLEINYHHPALTFQLLGIINGLWLLNYKSLKSIKHITAYYSAETIPAFFKQFVAHMCLIGFIIYTNKPKGTVCINLLVSYLSFLGLCVLWRFVYNGIVLLLNVKPATLKLLVLGDSKTSPKVLEQLLHLPAYKYAIIKFADKSTLSTQAIHQILLQTQPSQLIICYEYHDKDLLLNLKPVCINSNIKLKLFKNSFLSDPPATINNTKRYTKAWDKTFKKTITKHAFSTDNLKYAFHFN
jgi:FlaA1/EpsC-like NDP-sugar epimerase